MRSRYFTTKDSIPTSTSVGGPPPQLLPGVTIPNVARTKDGFVVMTLVLGEVGARGFGRLMRFAAERGGLEPDIAARDWGTWMQQLGAG